MVLLSDQLAIPGVREVRAMLSGWVWVLAYPSGKPEGRRKWRKPKARRSRDSPG